jgi:hypothetical protein
LLSGGGEVKLLVEVTVNSKEENSENFCPNYVQEFGLWGADSIHHLEIIHLLIVGYQGDLPPFFAPSQEHFDDFDDCF